MFYIQSQSYSLYGNFGQIWSKITQPRGQNENLIFLGQNISLCIVPILSIFLGLTIHEQIAKLHKAQAGTSSSL